MFSQVKTIMFKLALGRPPVQIAVVRRFVLQMGSKQNLGRVMVQGSGAGPLFTYLVAAKAAPRRLRTFFLSEE
jgi:hypothetical protein